MRKILRFFFTIVTIAIIASWLVPIAYGQTNNGAEQSGIQVEAAPFEIAPSISFFGNAIGGVTAGDLFYINAISSPSDFSLYLYITNAEELIHYLRYLILKVAVYVEDADGQWQQKTSQNGVAIPDAYITLQNSPVSIILPGLAHYKITIESGSYKSLPFNLNNDEISLSFYLNVEPL